MGGFGENLKKIYNSLSKSVFRHLYRFIGLIILILIFRNVDFTIVGSIIKEGAGVWMVFAALPLTFLAVIIRYYRWYTISRYGKMGFPFLEGLLIYIAGFGLGIVTPGRVGEFIKINYMRNEGWALWPSFFSVFLDRLLDIAVMVVIALLGSMIFIKGFWNETLWVFVFAALLLTLVCVFVFRKFQKKQADKSNSPEKEGMLNLIKSISWQGFMFLIVISFASWLVVAFQNFLFSISFQLSLSFIQVLFITSAVGLITLIPVTISGIGTREMALIYLFGQFGIGKEHAIVFSGCIFLTVILYGVVSYIPWEMSNIKSKLLSLKKDYNSNSL